MVHYSKNRGAQCATEAIMPESAALTHNMYAMHLKAHVSA